MESTWCVRNVSILCVCVCVYVSMYLCEMCCVVCVQCMYSVCRLCMGLYMRRCCIVLSFLRFQYFWFSYAKETIHAVKYVIFT